MERYGKKFKELDSSQKKEYIWEYYKFHILGGIIALVICFNLLNHFVFNPPKQSAVDILVAVAYVENQVFEEKKTEIVDLVEKNSDNKTATMEALLFGNSKDSQTQMIMTSKLVAKASTGEMDIMIVDAQNYDYFNSQEIFLPVTEYLSNEEISKYGDRFAYEENEEGKLPVAIMLDADMPIKRAIPGDYPVYFAISKSVKDIELAKLSMDALLK